MLFKFGYVVSSFVTRITVELFAEGLFKLN